jgi:ornithine cyclodeaminase/alanine dehydrogenase
MSLEKRTLVLTHAQVVLLLSMPAAVEAVEEAFTAYAEGRALMPPKVYLSLDAFGGDFRAMPSYLPARSGGHRALAGVKWVNSHPDNPKKRGLPSVMGIYVLSDPETALPIAIMDATVLTAARTGAAAAGASRALAKKDPKSMGFVGSGVQARTMLSAHRAVYQHELEIIAADIDPQAAAAFAKEAGGRVGTVEEAAGCDIVNTSTPGRAPAVRKSWLKPGAHINAMGADAPGKQELDSDVLTGAKVVIDDHYQATHSGEINVPLSSGSFRESDIHASLGDVLTGKRPGRTGDELTIFDSTGLAIQDVALAAVIVAAAREQGVGQWLELVPA